MPFVDLPDGSGKIYMPEKDNKKHKHTVPLQSIVYNVKNTAARLRELKKVDLWSCDRRSDTTAWHVNTDMAFADWQDTTCAYFVRAVCSLR